LWVYSEKQCGKNLSRLSTLEVVILEVESMIEEVKEKIAGLRR